MNVTWVTPLGELTDSMAKRPPGPPGRPDGLAAAEEDRHERDVHVVDQSGGEELADGGWAAADADVEAARGLLGRRKCLCRAGVDEVEGGTAFISIEGLT